MKTTIAGRLRNMDVAPRRVLLPLYEAVMNSFQAIAEARASGLEAGRIEIHLLRPAILMEEFQADIDGFRIVDDGIGFNDSNYESFCTADSIHKELIGGKGVGRFAWLKVFFGAEIESVFLNGKGNLKRQFKFEREVDPDGAQAEPVDNALRSTSVTLKGLRQPYVEAMPKTVEEIARALVEHLAPLLIRQDAALVSIHDGGSVTDLSDYFARYRKERAETRVVSLDDHEFRVTIFRMDAGTHRINLAAHGRVVTGRNLSVLMPGIPAHFGTDEPYVINCYVEGAVLDEQVDPGRSRFLLPSATQTDEFLALPSQRDIENLALTEVRSVCGPELEEINRRKLLKVEVFIHHRRPDYRPALGNLEDIIEKIPLDATEQKMDEILAHHMASIRVERRNRTDTRLSQIADPGLNPASLNKAVEELLVDVTQQERDTLAQHVANRKVIISLFERRLGVSEETGRTALESALHQIVFPMQTTSDDVAAEQNHLWMIDERLSYHSFLASDKKLKAVEQLEVGSDKRPDILSVDVFDHALTYTEGKENPYAASTIIEFKKPLRNDYTDAENPIAQVMAQVRDLRSGKVKNRYGRPVSLAGDHSPVNAYIVCDITDKLKVWAENAGLLLTPDRRGYYGYNNAQKVYIEVISFEKLLSDAKKRNRILFEKLGIESSG